MVIQKRITALFLIIGKIAIVKPFAESHQHPRKRGKGMEVKKARKKKKRKSVTLGGSDFMTYKISNWADHWLHC